MLLYEYMVQTFKHGVWYIKLSAFPYYMYTILNHIWRNQLFNPLDNNYLLSYCQFGPRNEVINYKIYVFKLETKI